MANAGNVRPTQTPRDSNLSSIDPSFKIVDTFHSLYENRLSDAGENPQLKNVVLSYWVNDLSAQNEAMVRSLKRIENCVPQKALESLQLQDAEPLKKRVAELEQCVESLNRTICEKDAQISRVMCESSQLKERCEQQGMTLQSHEGTTNENNALKAEIMDLKCCLREKECEIQGITQQLSEVTSALCAREEEMTRTAVNKFDFCSRLEQMQEELSVLRRENETKEELLKKYCRECTAMKRELAEAKRQTEEMCARQNELECLRDELAQKSCALEKAKAHIKELRSSSYGMPNHPTPPRDSGLCPQQLETPSAKLNVEGLKDIDNGMPNEVQSSLPKDNNQKKDSGGSGDWALIELQKKIENQKDLQLALTAEVAAKHDTIINLKEQIHDLEEKLRQTEMQAHFKDDIIRELRKEVKLGRAKESLAEMLGLKEGPRVQMKARIDRLSCELEDKQSEISRLSSLIDDSSLLSLENQVRTLTLDLESREKRMLAMCDKMDYIRSYLHQLKNEEQLSIKCGLEALITELNDDIESNREVRRTVSISMDKDPKDSNIIIINHRSHSLPNSALQRQVKNFQISTGAGAQTYLHGIPTRSMKFAFGELSKLKQLGSSLESSQTNLCDRWKAIRQISQDELTKCHGELDSIIDLMEADGRCIFSVYSQFEDIAARLFEAYAKCSPNEFLFTSTQDCLKNILEKYEANFDCDLGNSEIMVKMKSLLYQNLVSSVTIALKHLEQAKTNCVSQRNLIGSIDVQRLNKDKKTLASIVSNKSEIVKRLASVKNMQSSYSKIISDKITEFDSDFLQHLSKASSVQSELEVIVEQAGKLQGFESSLISVYTSTDDFPSTDKKEVQCTSDQGLDTVLKKVDSSKLLEILDNDTQLVELFSPPAPFRTKFSHSSFQEDSASQEVSINHVGIEERGDILRNVVTTLYYEIKSLITQVIQRDQKVFDFEKSGFALCQYLNQTQKEITNVLALSASLGISSEKLSSLVKSLSDTSCELQNLLKEAKTYMSEREMIEALRLKKELCISTLMAELTKNVEEIVNDWKHSQSADEQLLQSFSSQIQTYKEKILALESKIQESRDLVELDRVTNEARKDSVICELTEQLNTLKEQNEELMGRVIQEVEEKSALKTNNERTLEELQMKISKLQESLHEEKISSNEIERLRTVLKEKVDELAAVEAELESESAAAFDARTALRRLKDKFVDEIKVRDDEIVILRQEHEDLQNKLCMCEFEIEKLELRVQEYINERELIRLEEEAIAKSYKEKVERLQEALKVKDGALENLQQELKNFMKKNGHPNGKHASYEFSELVETIRSLQAHNNELTKEITKLRNHVDMPKRQQHSDHVPSSDTECNNAECSAAAYEKRISELLMERSNHILMMKRMRDFTTQLSKFRPHEDTEVDSWMFSSTSDMEESSRLSSAIETDEP